MHMVSPYIGHPNGLQGKFFPFVIIGFRTRTSRVRVIYVDHSRHNDTPCIGCTTADIAQGVFFFFFFFFFFVEAVVHVFEGGGDGGS